MINNLTFGFNNISQVLSIFLGLIVLVLAFYMIISGNHPGELISWSLSILGLSFVLCLLALIFGSLFCILKLKKSNVRFSKFWFETGLQFSNGISTLALTFTLLGISLGIGELSISKLDISSINQTIGKLTNKFSMAFFTSVIGLPLSSIFRAILIIIFERINIQKTDFLLENRIINRRTK